MKKVPGKYIEDMLFCIDRIEETTKDISFEEYTSKLDKMDIVERNLIKIGDAIEGIPPEIQKQYENIPWPQIKSLRNKLTHEYPDIKNGLIWKAIKEDLPELKKNLIIAQKRIKTGDRDFGFDR